MGEAALHPAIDEAVAPQVVTTRRARVIAMVDVRRRAGCVLEAHRVARRPDPGDVVDVAGHDRLEHPSRLAHHLIFFRDWWPAWPSCRSTSTAVGSRRTSGLPVHITEPIDVDEWLGGGTLPTQRLQDSLCGDPCARSIPARWYDGALTLVYYTHFIAAPLTALVLYLRNRLTWIAFMRRYIALYMAALLFYITYPMAPPWMASRDGYVEGNAGDPADRPRLVGDRTRTLPADPVAARQPGRGDAVAARRHRGARGVLRDLPAAQPVAIRVPALSGGDGFHARLLRRALRRRHHRRLSAGGLHHVGLRQLGARRRTPARDHRSAAAASWRPTRGERGRAAPGALGLAAPTARADRAERAGDLRDRVGDGQAVRRDPSRACWCSDSSAG